MPTANESVAAGRARHINLYRFLKPGTLGSDIGPILDAIDDGLGGSFLTDLVFTDPNSGSEAPGRTATDLSPGVADYLLSRGSQPRLSSFDRLLEALAEANTGATGRLIVSLRAAIGRAGLTDMLVMPSPVLERGRFQAPCFVGGTLIATPAGETAVEDLVVGGLVTLATGIETEIGWIGRRPVVGGADMPVRITAGALARLVPRRDLIVSPDHALFVDGVLVPAGRLLDGVSISRDESDRPRSYYHVALDEHGVLLAEGAPAESYRDTGRRQFADCALHFDPADAARFDPCAEVVAGGPRLDAIRAHLASHSRSQRQPA